MASDTYYKKVNAQSMLAVHAVQPLLEQLLSEQAFARPSDPTAAILTRLDEMQSYIESLAERPQHISIPMKMVRTRRIIAFFGADFTGKSTQCSMATSTLHGVALSPATLIEEAVNGGRTRRGEVIEIPFELQEEVRAAVKAHTPLSTQVLTALFANRIHQIEAQADGMPATREEGQMNEDSGSQTQQQQQQQSHAGTFVLDGYPNTMAQALALEDAVGEMTCAIQLYCPASVIKARRETITTTNTTTSPSGGTQRASHAESTGQGKLWYAAGPLQAQEVCWQDLGEYWKAKKVLFVVDGTQDRHECARVIKNLLNDSVHGMDATEWYRQELRSRAEGSSSTKPQLTHYKYTNAGLLSSRRNEGIKVKQATSPLQQQSAFPATLRAQFQCLGADEIHHIDQRARYTASEAARDAAMERRIAAAITPVRAAAVRDEAKQQRHTTRHVKAAEGQAVKRIEAHYRTLCRW